MRVSLRNVLGLDLRSLGAFRICLASVLLLDLCNRVWVLRDLFTDWGVLPRSVVIEELGNPLIWSLHFMSGRYEVMLLLAALAFVFGVMLLVGYRTRLATICSWVLFVSSAARNPAVGHGGDDILRMALFWSMFSPLGACFSIDARRSRFRPTEYVVLSTGTFALAMQLLLVYWWAGGLKLHPRWMSEGSALYYALALDQFARPLGLLIRELPAGVLVFITRATLALEVLGPLLFFVTWRQGILRFLAAVAFICFHIGLDLTLDIGLFPWACIAFWVATFPTAFWTTWWPMLAGRTTLPRALVGPFELLTLWFLRLSDSLPHPEVPRVHLTRLTRGPCALLFSLAVYWNFALWRDNDRLKLITPLREIGYTFRLHQHWGMFAPYPSDDDGWYVVDARLADGSRYDIWHDHKVDFTRPARLAPLYRDVLWRKYLMNLHQSDYTAYRVHFGRFLCRQWNEAHPAKRRVETLEVFFMREMTPPPGQPVPAAVRDTVWRHYCFQKPANWDTPPKK